MKKKSVIVLVVFFCLAAATNSIAQSKLSYSLSAGTSNPTSPDNFDTNWKTGYNIGAGVGYALHKNFQINSSLQFNRFGIDLIHPFIQDFHQLALTIAPTADYGDANVVTLTTNVKYSLFTEQKVVPYIVGGIGLYRLWMENDFKSIEGYGTNPLKNETSFLVNSGIGTKIAVHEKLSFFLETNFVNVFTDRKSTRYLPLRTGIIIK